VSATTAQHVADDLADRVDLILDGGPAPQGLESTVIGFEDGRPVLLRAGALARDDIARIVGPLATPEGTRISSPGQLASHYAPRTPLRLDATSVSAGEALLVFGPPPPWASTAKTLNLSPPGDLIEAAANLFSHLRALDAAGAKGIAVMPIPHDGLGEAINDRLARAAAPRG
jgi:L-threonylcarbamoyladenylate synthase